MVEEKKENPNQEQKQEKQEESPKEGMVVSSQDSKLKAAVSCIPIVGLIMYFMEKEDMRVRFYAAQGILIGVVGIVLGFVPVINFFVWLVALVVIIMVAMKAYQTEEKYKLPIIGDWAEQWASKNV